MKTFYYKVFFTLLISICNTQKGMESRSLTLAVKELIKNISSLSNKHKNINRSPVVSAITSCNVEKTNNTLFNLPIEQTPLPEKKILPKELCFNKNYFYNTILRKCNDGYHGIPADLMVNIINNGPTTPNFLARTSTINFTAAAIKTNSGKFEYRIPIIITDSFGQIFHIGMHKKSNANKTIDPITVAAHIRKLKRIVDCSMPKQKALLPMSNTCDYQLPWKESTYNVQITTEQLNRIYCCSPATQYTKETVSYTLPDGNLLIVMDPLNA